jgi:sugar transferase EpsL
MAFRIRDLLFASLALLLSSWLWVLLLPLLALTQQRIFFSQERTGLGGKPFRMYKFSTLRDIGPGEREEDAQRYRLTPLGRILRRLSLDELPQLWNVLRGDMSLVGPRPLIHEYMSMYSPEQRRRFETKPGITGWAQVNGRNAISFTERFQLDVWYVDHKSWLLDLRIMAMTLGKVFKAIGVYADDATTMAKFDGKN